MAIGKIKKEDFLGVFVFEGGGIHWVSFLNSVHCWVTPPLKTHSRYKSKNVKLSNSDFIFVYTKATR
jgi:hypothetical protein